LTRATLTEAQTASAITCPPGFIAGGMACGIKASGADDLALILAPSGATAAAMFTRNLLKAAPVVISQRKIRALHGRMRGLVINSGCANAATGEQGFASAYAVMDALAQHLGCDADEALMNSTGVIGEQLPHDRIIHALPELIAACASDGLVAAAKAIHTTDTRVKATQQSVTHAGRTFRVVGIAKGAGMIHPNMATTIGVIMTDAKVAAADLDWLLREAVDRSFHRITVDGDTSTNDSVFLLASGASGECPAEALAPAVTQVARDLAEMVVRDGEGAMKLIRVRVRGAATAADALQVAQTVASSLLVRTSVAGGDPNWGRILAAAGRSGVDFNPERVGLRVNNLDLFAGGKPSRTPKRALEQAYAASEVILDLDLGIGDGSEEFLTCDLTEQYVRVNADYTS
jgi:glutamate N-acetyltransferase / amino-acid N-acetyltransferase